MAFTTDVTWYFDAETEPDGSVVAHGHMEDFESEYEALDYLQNVLARYAESDTDAKLLYVSVLDTETKQFTYSCEFSRE